LGSFCTFDPTQLGSFRMIGRFAGSLSAVHNRIASPTGN
jgi:hypothetical protein